MKVNFKLFFLSILVIICIILTGNWIFGISIQNYLRQQERYRVSAHVENVIGSLEASLVKYQAITVDWARREETNQFVGGQAPDYPERNLRKENIKNLNIHFMVFLDKNRASVYRFYFDLQSSDFTQFPAALEAELAKALPEDPEKAASKILRCGDDFYLFSAAATMDSAQEADSNGFLLVGRKIDPEWIAELEKLSDSKILFVPTEKAEAAAGGEGAVPGSADTPYWTRISDDGASQTTYIIFENPDGSKETAAAEMTSTRNIYMGGMERLRYLHILYTFLVLFIVVLLFFILWFNVTNPLQKLSDELKRINIEQNRIGRLSENRNKEFSVISRTINNLFARIEEQQEKLCKSEARLIAAQAMARVGNWELDVETGKVWGSPEVYMFFGIDSASELSMERIERGVLSEYRQSRNEALKNLIEKDEKYDEVFKIRSEMTGEERFVRSRAIRLCKEDGCRIMVAGTIQDITEYKKSEEEILYLSNHDQLTGLYNRRFYEKALNLLDREENLPITVAMGDINGLKLINDSFGHAMGDELIVKTAEAIRGGCRAGDVAARLGGDELVIVMPKTDAEEAAKVIEKIIADAAVQKVGCINVSISFGHETKYDAGQNMKDILKDTEDHMYRNKLYESSSARSRAIDIIMNALYEKSEREMFHSMRVSVLCETIGKCMDFSKDEVNQIRTAGLVHDIGKIGIDEAVLNKKEAFRSDELKELMKHCEVGYRILSSANEFSEIANFVLEHHERFDGTGYPRHLAGAKISLQARIIAVADTYDAMTSGKPNRKAIGEDEAVRELCRRAGAKLDPEIVRIFVEKGLGKTCE